MQKPIKIKIDTITKKTVASYDNIRRGDTLLMTINIYQNSSSLSVIGQTVKLILRKADGYSIEKTITGTGNVLTAELDEQATLALGMVRGEIQLTDSNGTCISNWFTYIVGESLADDIIIKSAESIETLADMKAAIAEYQTNINAIAGTNESVQALNNIQNYINTNLPILETKTDDASTNIINLTNKNSEAQTTKTNLQTTINNADTKLQEFKNYDIANLIPLSVEMYCKNELLSINHNLNRYPTVKLIYTEYGAGVGGAGEFPAGADSDCNLMQNKTVYTDTNNLTIYVPNNYYITSPIVNKINDYKYIVTFIGSTRSILIELVDEIIEEDIKLNSEIIWKIKSAGGEAIYSTPVLATLSTGIKVIIYSSWDWYIYCRNATTGVLIWRYATGDVCYGRCQAQDVNGDGKIEIFGASHDGYIYCLDEGGNKLWSFANAYTREGTGTVSSAGSYFLTDTSKSWYPNSFMRNTTSGYNASVQITSGTGNGQILEISSVESNKIWFFNNWTTTPDATSHYKIVPKYASDINYQHAGTLSKESNILYLYATGFDGQLVKINASTGALVYKKSTMENIEAFPYVCDINGDGILEVLIATLDKHVYCLKSTDGSVVWSTAFSEPNDAFLNVKDIDNDGALEVLVASRDNRVHILNGITGVEKAYTRDTGGDIDCRVFIDPSIEGFICGSDSGYISAYDSDCECIWTYKAMDATNTSMISGLLNSNTILIQGDQIGGLHFLNKDGKLIKAMCLRGGIEGTPYIEQYTEYFILYVTTIEGWTYAIKIS